jgi:predicted enzyme related to lactoylglutathione lyase
VTGDTRPTAPAVRPFHLSLPVRDLDEAADWYVEVLGTGRRRPCASTGGRASVLPAGAHVRLHRAARL